MNNTLYLVCFISTKLDTIMATSPLYGGEMREGLKLSPVEGGRVDIHTPLSLYLELVKKHSQKDAIEETVRLFSDLGTDNRRYEVEKAIKEYIDKQSEKTRKMLDAAEKVVAISYPNKGNQIKSIQLIRQASGCYISEARDAYLKAWEKREEADKLQVTEREELPA